MPAKYGLNAQLFSIKKKVLILQNKAEALHSEKMNGDKLGATTYNILDFGQHIVCSLLHVVYDIAYDIVCDVSFHSIWGIPKLHSGSRWDSRMHISVFISVDITPFTL
jgi:hypothetical protein